MESGSKQRGYVLITTKPPWAGVSKTRLTPAVGPEGTVTLAAAFLRDLWAPLQSLPWARPAIVLGMGGREDLRLEGEVEVWRGEPNVMRCAIQSAERALAEAPFVILFSSDIPGLPVSRLEDAYQALQHHDVVTGSDHTGIPYMTGIRREAREKFGSCSFMECTSVDGFVDNVKKLGGSIKLLEPWFDVDEPADLDRLHGMLQRGEAIAPHTARALQELGYTPGQRKA